MKMRKLVVFLATAMLVLPLAAFALGFGGIKLNSALDEPFDAEIELLSPTPDDITNLKVKLASPDAFLRAGIDRPAVLTDLQFAVKQRDDGSYYIHVTSRKPIREPFLDVLLEMDWQNGRMLREYTVLLDPPALRKKQPTVVEVPPTAPQQPAATQPEPAESPFLSEPTRVSEAPSAAEPELAPAPAPAPAPEPVPVAKAMPAAEPEFVLAEGEQLPRIPIEKVKPEPEPEPEVQAEPAPEPAAAPAMKEDAPLPTPAEAPQMAMAPEAAVFEAGEELFPRIPIGGYEEPLGELDYGIVRKGDNLWTIAEKLRPNDSISIYQVMMALLRSNPDAFIDGNVHRLKVGHVLRIDDPGMLTAISKQQASLEYQAQTQAWEEYRQQVARSAAPQAIVASETEPAVEAETAATAELTLASPDGSELQGGTGTSEQAEATSNDILTLQDELRQLRDSAAVAGGRNEELNARLREMEAELERMQRAVTVKDDELAAMQQQMAQLKEQASAPPPAEAAAAPVEEPAAVVEAEAPAAPAEEAVAEPAAPAKSPVELAEEIAQQEKAAQPEAAATPAAAEEGLLDKVMGWVKGVTDSLAGVFGGLAGGGSLLTLVALPVVLVLLLLMIIVIRRRRKADTYQESILTGGPSSVTSAAAAAEESEEESSFLSDFAVSGAGAIPTEDSEVDPLTEADVFIAYGRYEAAEERLKEAIQKDPQRAELKLKLLELYYTTKNKPAFENAAEDFYASLGDDANDNPMWQKVVGMGAELVPANPLFSGAAVAGGAALADMAASQDPGVGLSDSQVMDIGLDTGVFDADDLGAGEAPAQPAADEHGAMDFSFDLDESPATATETGGGMEFSPEAGDTTASEPAVEAGSDMDFSLDLEETPASSATEEVAAVEEGGLDFNLDMGDSGGVEEAAPDAGLDFSPETEETTSGASAEADSLDFDLDVAGAGNNETAEFDLDIGTDLDQSDSTMAIDLGSTSSSELGLESSSSTPAPTMELETDTPLGGDLDIGSSDEVGTKLDLAKAYIDMGDPDGARSILDEVMDEGNDSQKQEAQELLQQIA